MELTLAGIDPDSFDVEALTSAVAAFAAIAPHAEPLRVTVAADFEGAVRERVTDADYAAQYTQERLFGQAAAKVIAQDDGSIDLLVDAALVHGDAPKEFGLERLFSHEAFHVLLARKNESSNDIRLRRGLSLHSRGGYFVGVAPRYDGSTVFLWRGVVGLPPLTSGYCASDSFRNLGFGIAA